ncbi:hypothetical protein ABDK00_001590 [Niabella insulamsoli]|uniref:CdiA C-terminal domain-containing protein n=1 Tax=Niabella insulamsoli TaxID=3144874 RepID=UPI0031FD7106
MCTYESTYFYSDRRRVQLSTKMNVPGLINKALDELFNKSKIKRRTDRQLFERTREPLKEAVNEGLSMKVEFGTPNYEFLKQLQYNVSTFAAFKNHAQIKEMAALLVDDNGNRRSKQEFRKKALEIDDKYNVRYLDVEYDAAVRQARSAAQWQKALTTKHLFPNIKYLPSVSANKREQHERYYNIVRPMDDPFWNINLPIKEWGCKCGWKVTDEEVTDIPDDLPAPTKDFAFNPGKTGQIFQIDSTEYAKAVPNATKEQLIKHAKKIVDYEMAADLPYINVYSSKAGTQVLAHPLAFDNNDFQAAINNARKVANSKTVVVGKMEILPTLNASSPEQNILRNKLLNGVKGEHNPDYRIDKVYYDLKEPVENKASKNTIRNLISDAHSQADGIVLVIEKENYISQSDLYRQIYLKYMHEAYDGFYMKIYFKGEWLEFTRKSFLKMYRK